MTAQAHKGIFFTFEGSEGSGKSTQIQMVKQYLESLGKKVVFVREPGGVKISEHIRDILLDVRNTDMTDECEMLLYMAARSQLVREVIQPALRKGKIVLCDRYLDSTLAYQGYGSGVDLKMIRTVGAFATFGITPDLTFIFDLSVAKGMARLRGTRDRIERRATAYHKRVRKGYQTIAAGHKKRVKLIDASKDKATVRKVVQTHLDNFFRQKK